MRRSALLSLSLALACAGSASVAEGSNWEFRGALYLFASETELSSNGVDVDLSFSEALENLQIAGMATLAATNGPWTLVADVMHFNLQFEEDTSGPLFDGIKTDSITTLFTAQALYEVYGTPEVSLSLGAGFRSFSTDTTLDVGAGLLPGFKESSSEGWTDALVAARGRLVLSDTWDAALALDYGNFNADRETYQVTATFGYALTEDWTARFGYRQVSVDNEDIDFSFKQSGPILGAVYKF